MPRGLLQLGRRPTLVRWLSRAGSTARSPHNVLGVPRGAPPEQVKLAYYKLAMRHHPDRDESTGAVERFTEIGAAYEAILGKSKHSEGVADDAPQQAAAGKVPKIAPFAVAFPRWVYRLSEYLQRIPQRFDLWLPPSHSSVIYQHVRAGELADAFALFDEMRRDDIVPSHAVYEILMRGCAIAMTRPPPGRPADHLTLNLIDKVLELWGDMQLVGRNPDYLTHVEIIRALGKGGAVPQALQVFESMLGKATLLPEERAFNSIYEACVFSGHYADALRMFDEHEEMRKSLWKPRYTPVGFSLLLTAAAIEGERAAERLAYLPRILDQMQAHGVLPRQETCENLISACLGADELPIAERVVQLAERAGHQLEPRLVERVDKARALNARREMRLERGRDWREPPSPRPR